jgi:hypothetical protein
MLIHTCHAMLRCAVALGIHFQNGMVWARQGMYESNTATLTQMRKTQFKPLAAWQGMGTAWYV